MHTTHHSQSNPAGSTPRPADDTTGIFPSLPGRVEKLQRAAPCLDGTTGEACAANLPTYSAFLSDVMSEIARVTGIDEAALGEVKSRAGSREISMLTNQRER